MTDRLLRGERVSLRPLDVPTLARWLFEDTGHHRITIDPALANERAIRSYEGVGFVS